MKNIFQKAYLLRIYLGYFILFTVITIAVFATTFTLTKPVHAATYSQITSQLSFGSRGENVTNLQLFLASNKDIYPEGMITGYYGPLTQAAVVRFQNQYGIDPVGRVGPITLQKINTLILGGGFGGISDISGPQFYSVNQTITSTGATFTWTTNELATAKIFYYNDWITMNEGDINSVGFGSTNGWTATNDGLARMSQQVIITGLQPNTVYHYVLVSTDLAGNVSVWNPNTTFKTK
jgi:peptidoglycan hydrolase-like protein with peptidoglycan-binding domain